MKRLCKRLWRSCTCPSSLKHLFEELKTLFVVYTTLLLMAMLVLTNVYDNFQEIGKAPVKEKRNPTLERTVVVTSTERHKTPKKFYVIQAETNDSEDDVTFVANDFSGGAEREVQNFPMQFLLEKMDEDYYSRKNWTSGSGDGESEDQESEDKCAELPKPNGLEISNNYWQHVKTSQDRYYLFSAHLDNRTQQNKFGPDVRITTMIDGTLDVERKMYCQVWYEEFKEPLILQVYSFQLLWIRQWGMRELFPMLLSCRVAQAYASYVPVAVSLVEQPCDTATNVLKLHYDPPTPEKPKGFAAVCVKSLNFFEDISVTLLEWIELIRAMGAEKIVFYQYHVHENISKVLKFYENEGFVDVVRFSLPAHLPNHPILRTRFLKERNVHRRYGEVIQYTDCLYRNVNLYDWVVLLDVDELVVPLHHKTWRELMENVTGGRQQRKNWKTHYGLRHIYFMPHMLETRKGGTFYEGIPRFFPKLQNVYSSSLFTRKGFYIKCFHNTDRVMTLHNHYPMKCLRGNCQHGMELDMRLAILAHHRARCHSDMITNCYEYTNDIIMDTTLWRYKEQVVRNGLGTMIQLGYFPPESIHPNINNYMDTGSADEDDDDIV